MGNGFDVFFELDARNRHIPTAADAADADIGANAENFKAVGAAGVFFFHFKDVSGLNMRNVDR